MFPSWLKTALNIVLAGLLILVAFFIIDKLSVYLIKGLSIIVPLSLPFLLAIFLSFLMEPLIKLLQQRVRLSRGLAVAISMLLLVVLFGTILSLLILRLITELIHLSKNTPYLTQEIQYWVEDSLPRLQQLYGELPPSVTQYIQSSFGTITADLQNLLGVVLDTLLSTFSAIPAVIAFVIVSLLATYFISKDRSALAKQWVKLIPAPYGQKSLYIFSEVFHAFISYLRATVILVSISTTISIVGLHIIGADYALTMGLLIGFFDIIPVLGPSTVFLPWIGWTMVSGDIAFGIKLSILYGIVMVNRQTLEPKIVASNLGLYPLATLIAMFVGFKTWGFIGMVMGPILLIAIQAVIKAGIQAPKVKGD